MPHQSLKLIPGVDQNRTLAFNETAISSCNLIRFIPDRQGVGLVQKLGGWTQYSTTAVNSVVRALWAWEDTNSYSWLAAGAEQALNVYLDSASPFPQTVTPQTTTANIAVSFTTVATPTASSIVSIAATGSNLDGYDVVDIRTQVSVGGLILFGTYPVIKVDANNFQIQAVDAYGQPVYPTSNVTGGGAVPSFSTTTGSALVSVTLADHNLQAGDVFPVLVSTTVGGVTLFGNHIVSSVTSSSVFVISARSLATSTTTASENGGNVQFIYYNGIGPLASSAGYGTGGYGTGGYGSGGGAPTSTGTPITTTDWTLDNWGEILLACPLNGPIYQWNPNTNSAVATIIYQAPTASAGMFVAMPQRQVVAWGTTYNGVQDPLQIRWSDVDDYSSWTLTPTNQAGGYRIPKGSRIVECIQGPQQGLIWTDLGVWAMQYVGPPYVYQFSEVGTGCGLIGRKAAASMSGVVYWMGQSQFFRLSGGGVEPIQCPVWDVIFQDLDTDNLDKIRVAPNSRFNEIAWFYPTKGNGGEINAYVKYNIVLNQWDYGTLSRTAWLNESVLGPPIGAGVLPNSSSNYLVQHETSTNAVDANNQPWPMDSNFQTGYFALSDADVKMFVDQVWPDMKWGYFGGTENGTTVYQSPTTTVGMTFYYANYAGETPLSTPTFSLSQSTTYVTPRMRGRLVSIKVGTDGVGGFWRLGNIRYRVQVDGKY